MEHQHSGEMSPVGESATDNCFLFALWGRRYISCVSPHLNAGCKAIKSVQSCRTGAPTILHISQSQAMGSCEECLVVRWMRTQTLSTAITDLLMPSCLVHSATLTSFLSLEVYVQALRHSSSLCAKHWTAEGNSLGHYWARSDKDQ